MTLAQAPARLRAAVHRTVGLPSGSSGISEQAELTASDGAPLDQFGDAVAIDGSIAVVGAPLKNSYTGAAYVFVRSGGSWSEEAELTPDAPGIDEFGASVAVDGSTALIGAPFQGVTYVFVRSSAGWSQQAALTASGSGYFGYSVAIDGSTAVIGAAQTNGGVGSAYVFVRSGGVWSQQAELTASDAGSENLFGYSAAIDGSTVVIGAPNANQNAGAAYVFVGSGTAWSQQAELTERIPTAFDEFGVSVAISGSTVVVGAPGKRNTGAAYVFVPSGSTWSQQAELSPSDIARNDAFGDSVAVLNSTAMIGAPNAGNGAGAAYEFVQSGRAWSEQAELTASDGVSGDRFGAAVAIDSLEAIIGAPFKNGETGAAYVFGPL